jgi:hypothetical protein
MSLNQIDGIRDTRIAFMEGRAESAAKIEGLVIERDLARCEVERYRRRHKSATKAFAGALVVLVPAVVGLAVTLMVGRGCQ